MERERIPDCKGRKVDLGSEYTTIVLMVKWEDVLSCIKQENFFTW